MGTGGASGSDHSHTPSGSHSNTLVGRAITEKTIEKAISDRSKRLCE